MRICAILLGLMFAVPALASTDEEAVRAAVLDYIEGYYEVAPERTERACHPQLSKYTVVHGRGDSELEWLRPMSRDVLVDLVAHGNADGHVDAQTARREIVINEISGTIASVTLVAESWFDYMQLAKLDGEWRIVTVLWSGLDEGEMPEGASEDEALIEQACRDYADAFYRAEPALVLGATHPMLAKYAVRASEKSGEFLYPLTREQLGVRAAGFEPGWVDPESARHELTVYSRTHDSASVKLTAHAWFDYLHLAKLNGRWQIVHCLWEPLEPPASNG